MESAHFPFTSAEPRAQKKLGPVERALLLMNSGIERLCDLEIVESEHAPVRQAQAARLGAVLPVILCTNIAFAVVILCTLLWSGWIIFPLVWTGGIALFSILGIRRSLDTARRSAVRAPGARFTVRTIQDSILLAAPWAVLMIVASGSATPVAASLGLIGICLSSVVIFVIGVLPAAAVMYLVVLWSARTVVLASSFGTESVVGAVIEVTFLILALFLLRLVAQKFLQSVRATIDVGKMRELERVHLLDVETNRRWLEAHVAGFQEGIHATLEVLARSVSKLDACASLLADLSKMTRSAVANLPAMVDDAQEGLLGVDRASKEMATLVEEIRGAADSAAQFIQTATDGVRQSEVAKAAFSAALCGIQSQTELIRDVARQINRVALNAMIEAARVGSQGAGFSAVASEVKALANRTNEAAEIINGRIREIVVKADESVAAMSAMEAAATAVVDVAGSILASSDRQSQALSEIVSLLGSVVAASQAAAVATTATIAGSQGTLDQADRVAEAAGNARDIAVTMQDLVERFSAGVLRGAAADDPREAVP